jgi:alpha-tubulin suppressor-like RCC1 family protein
MLYANGSNVNYVMGMGDSAEKEYPNIVRVPFPYPISNVTCSDYYTAVVTTDGQCWMVGSHREVTGKTKSVPNWRLYDRGVADCQLGKDFHAFLYKDGTLKIAMHSTTRIVRGVNKISATNYYLIAVTDTNIEYMVGNRFQDLCIDISKFINRTWNLEVSLADSHLMACFCKLRFLC